MKDKRSKILAILTEILRFGPAAGVVAYYSQDFFEGSEYKISAGLIFLAILIVLRFGKAVKKIIELPGGTGLAIFAAIFSGLCMFIGEQIFYVSVTYLMSILAALPIEAMNTLPTLEELQRQSLTKPKAVDKSE